MSSLREESSVLLVGRGHGGEDNMVATAWEDARNKASKTGGVDGLEETEMAMDLLKPNGETLTGSAGGNFQEDGDGDIAEGIDAGQSENTEETEGAQKVMEYLQDARENGMGGTAELMFQGYKKIHQERNQEDNDGDEIPTMTEMINLPVSPSVPADTPSLHVGYHTLHIDTQMLIEHC